MEISIVPLGTSSASVSSHVKKILKTLKDKPDIEYRLTPMGTVIDAESVEKLLQIASAMHRKAMDEAVRVNTFIKIDDRSDKKLSMDGKIRSVCGNEKPSPEAEGWLRNRSVQFLKNLGVKKGQTILDFGCRSGTYTFAASEAVTSTGRVFGVDKQRQWLEKIESVPVKKGAGPVTALGSVSWHETVESGSVDSVLLFDVLHPGYFPEKEQRLALMKQLNNVLKKDGCVYALATHLGSYGMTEEDFRNELESCGFSLTGEEQGECLHDGALEHNTVFIFRKT